MPTGIYKHRRGFKLSEDHKKKISDAHVGKKNHGLCCMRQLINQDWGQDILLKKRRREQQHAQRLIMLSN